MNIKLIAIGKTDNKALQTLIDDYTKRLSLHQIRTRYYTRHQERKNLSESQQKRKKAN
jgi:23S rRNA (pseudouridine1915-N3)-methyltransferase